MNVIDVWSSVSTYRFLSRRFDNPHGRYQEKDECCQMDGFHFRFTERERDRSRRREEKRVRVITCVCIHLNAMGAITPLIRGRCPLNFRRTVIIGTEISYLERHYNDVTMRSESNDRFALMRVFLIETRQQTYLSNSSLFYEVIFEHQRLHASCHRHTTVFFSICVVTCIHLVWKWRRQQFFLH